MHCLRIYLLLLSTSNTQILASLILPNPSASNSTLPQLSEPILHADFLNDSSCQTCRMPSNPLWLNYTLQSTLSRSGISALLNGAQRQVEVQQDLGFGHQRIGPPLGRYRYNRADLTIHAGDFEAGEPPNLTWDMVLEAIELVRYCTVGRGVYLEMEAGIYYGDVGVGVIEMKLARMPDGVVGDE